MTLEEFVAHYGIWAIGIGAGIEGETTLVLGGIAVHRGLIAYTSAVLAAGTGSFIVDQSLFAIGRKFRDRPRIQRLIGTKPYARALSIFERHPRLFVFGFRFLYGIRTVSPLVIGTSHLPQVRFATINLIAAFVWSTIFITLGYLGGQAIEALFGRIGSAAHYVVPAVVIALIVGFLTRRALHRRAD